MTGRVMWKAAVAGALVAMIGSAAAEELKIIVPLAPGGVDLIARPIAAAVKELLDQPVIVDTRGGAGGILGTSLVASARPDGNTVLMGTLGPAITP